MFYFLRQNNEKECQECFVFLFLNNQELNDMFIKNYIEQILRFC